MEIKFRGESPHSRLLAEAGDIAMATAILLVIAIVAGACNELVQKAQQVLSSPYDGR